MYFSVKTAPEFFVMGAVAGPVLGGSQALSRSLFSLMIPKGREAEYFSLYEIGDRGTSWFWPLLFGLALQYTGSRSWYSSPPEWRCCGGWTSRRARGTRRRQADRGG